MRDFKAKISMSKLSRQGLKARIGHVFAEGTVNEFHKRYSAHIQNLIMVQTLVDGILDETLTLSQAICPRIMSLNLHPLTGLRTRQHAFRRGDSDPESWYDRDGTVDTRISRASKTRNEVALATKTPIMPIEEPYKMTKIYVFPIGKLLVHHTKPRSHRVSPEDDEWRVTKIDAVFIPPWFLSNTMIRAHMRYYHSSTYRSPEPTYTLQPISINQDPDLEDALWRCDTPKLRDLFSMNRARPTDMVLDRGSENVITLLEIEPQFLRGYSRREF
ncbi:MAG: hypothetical protein Q9167_006889 [Letrouitia subvulpina]